MGLSDSQMLRLREPERRAKTLPVGIKPIKISWQNNKEARASIHYSDGLASPGSCIRCIAPPCIEYSDRELELGVFKDFPSDKNDHVCPTGAITWPFEEDAPIINSAKCILCGLCVSRCPTRAIHLDETGAQINDQPTFHLELQDFLVTKEVVESIAEDFNRVEEEGFYRIETDLAFKNFRDKFKEISRTQSAQFPNHLARNLLIACGIGAAMRRRGDTNIRLDMILGPPGVARGTSEVDLGEGVLDAPRNILDNVAVLVARYGTDTNDIVPLIVSWMLPNQRSEYWHVIKDIRDVLGVKINSITIGALILLVWNRRKISIITGEELYIDYDETSLRSRIERILEREISVSKGYLGFLECEK